MEGYDDPEKLAEAIEKGYFARDTLEALEESIFLVEKELGIKITPDYPALRFLWLLDQLKRYYENGKTKS